jgi:hypothetical protein
MKTSTIKKVALAILIPLLLVLVAAAGAAIWYFLIRSTPKKVYEAAVAAARQRDVVDFQSTFSSSSTRALEGSWTGETVGRAGSWSLMMEGLLEQTGAPPEFLEEEIAENDEAAKIKIRLRKKRRTVYMVKEDGDWKIDVLSGINAGISEDARKAKKKKVESEDSTKEKEFTEEPKASGWWKKE